jgi:hypothetical protein
LLVALGVVAPASAAEPAKRVGKFTMTTKITSVHAAARGGLVARGVVIGKLNAGGTIIRDRAPARFRVSQRQQNGRCVATHAGTCQILDLVLGPLHLDLLGLVVDLYGQTKSDPVHVSITGEPGHGLLGDLLCSLAGGANITSLAQFQSLLSSLGVNLTETQLQNLLNQLGIGDLTAGLSQLQIQQILAQLGLGSSIPPG